MKGRIFDLIEFALHDGPGVRTTVFLKGCPLRCKWCHNPESYSFDKELMVLYGDCSHCGKCLLPCPSPGGCTACGACVHSCPLRLRKIIGEDVEARELAQEVKKSHQLFERSGGGVTISGGEPLFQHEFCIELMGLLSSEHIALDTSGFAEKSIFEAAVRLASLVLFDVKVIDAAKHRQYTGVDNELIMENLGRLCRCGTPFIVRVPLIGGVNSDESFARDLCRKLQGAPNLLYVELLPYHHGAALKRAMLKRTCDSNFCLPSAPESQLCIYSAFGIKCVIN